MTRYVNSSKFNASLVFISLTMYHGRIFQAWNDAHVLLTIGITDMYVH
jgi:hypothetical protein